MPNIIAALILAIVIWAATLALCDVMACNGGIAEACKPVVAYYKGHYGNDK